MKKSYIVDSTCNDMRLDRWLRLKIGKIPQGLVEKYLRTGKIKLNKKLLFFLLLKTMFIISICYFLFYSGCRLLCPLVLDLIILDLL